MTKPLGYDWPLRPEPALRSLNGSHRPALVARPAFVHAAFQPTRVLKTVTSGDAGNRFLRRRLVQFQFGISVALIAVIGIVYNQVDYARNKGLGFETEQTLYFRTGYPGVKDLSGPIEDVMRQVPGVVATSRFTQIPFSPYWPHRNVHLGHGDQGIQISSVGVDEGFVDLFAMKLQAGRNIQMEVRGEVIINETAVRSFGSADPSQVISLPIDVTWRKEGTVVGVVEDFHFESIRHKISPVALYGRETATPVSPV